MRFLGIDYGSKRVGVALSDENGNMAFPHIVLNNDEQLIQKIEEIAKEKKVAEIVMGQSLNLNGVPNPVQADIEEFIGDLTLHLGLPIHLEPEQLSTQAALREQGRNAQTDASAAALILESFLAKQRRS